MNSPSYIWICHKCGQSNAPHTDGCASCGFAAISSGAEIHLENEEQTKLKQERNANISSNLLLFYPEGFIAGFLALFSPLWAIKLIMDGHLFGAFCLSVVVFVCGYGFFWGMRNNLKFIAYLAMVLFLLAAWVIGSVL